MATDVTSMNIMSTALPAEKLEHIARDTRIFVSMPYVKGITPRVLVERGSRDISPSNGVQRWHGVFKPDEIGLPAFDHGLLYGDAVFEGVLVKHGRLFQWREHLDRLYASAEKLRLRIPYTQAELSQHVLESIKSTASGKRGAYLRLVVTRGLGDLGINPAKCVGSTVYCITSTLQLYPDSFYDEGLHLALARRMRRPNAETLDPQIKSCNYLNNILALLETSDETTQETLMLSQEGFIAEATTDNIFLVTRHRGWDDDPSRITISTPVAQYCLKGITRELVLGYARSLGFQLEESAVILPSDLIGNDKEIFLTGTGAGLVPVVTVDGRSIGNGIPGPITSKFRHLLEVDLADPTMGLPVDATHEEVLRYLEPRNKPAAEISADFVRAMFQTIDSGNWNSLQRVFCPDIIYERPGYAPLVGFDRVKKFYAEERVIASGNHMLEGVVVTNQTGACWGRFIGKHKNGSSIDEAFADTYVFQDGKVRRRKSFFFRPAV
jgi:branched-chain amino acid aminotransferase